MSKSSRATAAAQAMQEAAEMVSVTVEAVENKHHLTYNEAMQVLVSGVMTYLTRDGEVGRNKIKERLDDFADMLVDYVEDVYGVRLYEPTDYV